jgi:hypothetical protein
MTYDRFEIMDLWTDEEREAPQIAREEKGCCEYCGSTEKVAWRGSMTRYQWDQLKTLESPNRKMFLCEKCEDEYVEHWRDMWSNVPGYG